MSDGAELLELSDDEYEVESDSFGDDNWSETSSDGESTNPRVEYSLVGIFSSFVQANTAADTRTAFVYRYLTRYKTERLYARIYKCRSHQKCLHRIKIVSIEREDESSACYLYEGEIHTVQAQHVTRRGIFLGLRDELDAHIRMGWGAKCLRTLLELKYVEQPSMLAAIPSARQLDNRKAYLVRNTPGGWDLKNYATLNAWASTRMCTSREQFFDVDDPNYPRMDELIVLGTFMTATDEAGEPTSFGVIVSSRRVFRNVWATVRDLGEELVCATDGTYKLHFGGWTVVDCGSESVTWTRQTYAHRFIPWAYMLIRSESIESYTKIFETVCERAQTFFELTVDVAFASLDHSESIASAFLRVWPRAKLLTCWPHLIRQARKKRSLLSDVEAFDTIIKPDLRLLHSARSHSQFLAMATVVVNNWKDLGHEE